MSDLADIPSPTKELTGMDIVQWLDLCIDRMDEMRDDINRINVFPVADSDTGTNLLVTLKSAQRRADDFLKETGLHDARLVARAIANGAVHGARGNSGIIISQLLRALSDCMSEATMSCAALAQSFSRAVELVEEALIEPREGTVLSVLRFCAQKVSDTPADTINDIATIAAEAAAAALAKTPEQLEVLEASGVVDAGGRGLLVILDSLVETVSGHRAPREELAAVNPAFDPAAFTETKPAGIARKIMTGLRQIGEAGHDGEEIEVMYLLRHTDTDAVSTLRSDLAHIGNSVAVVADAGQGDQQAFTVHVHTNQVGSALECGLSAGEISDIRISALTADGEHEHPVDPAAALEPEETPEEKETVALVLLRNVRAAWNRRKVPDRSVVAMVPTEEMAEVFQERGVSPIVISRDTLGSEEALHTLFTHIAGLSKSQCLVLPNGAFDRVHLEQLDYVLRQTGQHVLIVPTSSLTEGLAACAVYDELSSLSIIGFDMADAARECRGASVLHSTGTNTFKVLAGKRTMGRHDTAAQAMHAAITAAITTHPHAGILTLLRHHDISQQAITQLHAWLSSTYPDIEIVDIAGGDLPFYLHCAAE